MASVESKSSKRSRQSSMGPEVDLHLTNPELFKASPRPGGFLKIRVPPRGEDYDYNLNNNNNSDYDEAEDCRCDSDPTICISMTGSANESIMLRRNKHGQTVKLPNLIRTSPGREFRLKRAVESKDWTIQGIDDTDTLIEISNPIQDTLNMLAVTISTIMMMAAQVNDIEDVYLDWATKYLNCIVDEEDEDFNRPPNVQGILNHILFLKMGGKVTGSDNQKSPRGSPPSSLKKGSDNRSGTGGPVAGGSVGGGSGAKTGSAGGGGASGPGGGSNRPSSGGGGSRNGSGTNPKGVSIMEYGGPRTSTPNRTITAVKSR